MADERREHEPGLHRQSEPGWPTWSTHSHSPAGRPDGYPPLASSWVRKNFTLGNIIVIFTLLLAAGAWVRSTETRDIALGDRVQQTESRVQRLEQDTISKELLGARLDTIAERLKAIEDRLTKIERMRQ